MTRQVYKRSSEFDRGSAVRKIPKARVELAFNMIIGVPQTYHTTPSMSNDYEATA